MRRRVLPALSTALLSLALLPGAAGAALAAGQSAPLFAMDHNRMTPAGVTAPGGHNYGLFSCQVGLSTGQCYDPYQMRTAYGVDSLIAAGHDGSGETIVIVDAFQSPNIVSELSTFDTFYGLPAANFTQVAPDGLTPFVPGNGNMTGWAEEITLDVLWAHAIAPGASIVLDLAKDNNDTSLISVANYAVNNHLGDVVSMSFGDADLCGGSDLANQWHQVFANGTQKSMTFFASSGDQGAAQPSCDGNSWIQSTSSPASDPLATAVGGTELHAADYCLTQLGCDPTQNPAAGTWLGEVAWNEGPPYGDFQGQFASTLASGGGYSTIWDEPSWQKSQVKGSGKEEGVPDVSYNAAVLHGVLTYLDIPGVPAGFYRFGGTSAGSPQWAAITAIADQMAGHALGFLNKGLYKIGQAPPHYGPSFHDITSGTNAAVELDSANNPVSIAGYNAGSGWDAVTGLGSPKAPGLVGYLNQFVSKGDGNSAINESKPHGNGNGKGHSKPN